MAQKQWTNSLSTHRLGELDLLTSTSSLSSLPQESMMLGDSLPLTQEVSQTKMGLPLSGSLRPYPNLPCCLRSSQTEQQKHQASYMPIGLRGLRALPTQKTFCLSFLEILFSLEHIFEISSVMAPLCPLQERSENWKQWTSPGAKSGEYLGRWSWERMFLPQKWRVWSTSSFSQPHAHLAPRLLEQEESLQMRFPMHSGISTRHMLSGLWLPWMANSYVHLFVLFFYLAPCLNRDTESRVSCIMSSHGAICVSVVSYCSEFGTLFPNHTFSSLIEPGAIRTPPCLPLSSYPLHTISPSLSGFDLRVRIVLWTPSPLFSSQLAFLFFFPSDRI